MAGKRKDLTGNKYNRLTVISFSHMKGKHSYWNCKCTCGKDKTARSDCLKNDTVKSCGCLNREAKRTTHGLSKTKLYHVWAGMKDRCYNENSHGFTYYGSRGINVCEQWKNDYIEFHKWAFESGYKEGLTIERINVNGNYDPSNCKWITQEEQTRNMTSSRKITYDGKTQTISEWARELKINRVTLNCRLRVWSIEDALTRPVESKVQRLSKA
ncbi:hypothetical protein [Rossellomorea marisflavi]|uniref:hypothetical protein n=1 Tax=Rossellomorea marisflavi TaxID=189381 RepID=UPI00345CC507